MEYGLSLGNRGLGTGLTASEVCQLIKGYTRFPDDRFEVTFDLPIQIFASVERAEGVETVKIDGGGTTLKESRKELPVSCSPDGESVPVRSFNIEFRPYNDEFTDRGIVWVIPGSPACGHLAIKGAAIVNIEVAGLILEEAERIVDIQLINKLADAATLSVLSMQ